MTIPTIVPGGPKKGGYGTVLRRFQPCGKLLPVLTTAFPRSIGLGSSPDTPCAAPSVPGKRDHLCPCPVCSASRASVF